MKKIVLYIVLQLGSLSVLASTNDTIKAHFDERVDLMALIARLSGAEEYCKCYDKEYADSVDRYFRSHKHDKAITIYQRARSTGCGYDAVAAFALHLKATDNKMQPFIFDEHIRKGSDDSFDRWQLTQKSAMLNALNDFYIKTDFHKWYESTAKIRAKYEAKQQKTYDKLNLKWYDTFFKKSDNIKRDIIVSLLVGQNNYGLSYEEWDGTFVTSPVYGIWEWNDLTVVVHEFCHPYCNPLIDANWDKIKNKAEQVFEQNKEVLSKQAYKSAKIMMYETFVRASVVNYVMEFFPDIDTKELLKHEKSLGFGLIEPMTQSLEKYRKNKYLYPTMDSYMNVLINDINNAGKVE